MGRKCNVLNCLSDSTRTEDFGVSFHKIPLQPGTRKKWFELCKISDEKKDIKIIYVCSRHFLRADFCEFKGRKYMLRQGILPSVFPWDKSKLEAIKMDKPTKKSTSSVEKHIKAETDSENTDSNNSIIKSENKEITNDYKQLIDEVKLESEPIDFTSNNQIEALDFNNEWTSATIVEVDEGESEVLIHFDKHSNKYDEWISMDSARLRSIQEHKDEENEKSLDDNKFKLGEKCMAFWNNTDKFPATITQALENDSYEVLFDDGYVKTLKLSRLEKITKQAQTSQLFDPVRGTKEERREKKRKLNVAALFGKRQRLETGEGRSRNVSPAKMKELEEEGRNSGSESRKKKERIEEEIITPKWNKGLPIGTPSTILLNEGIRKTVIVDDPNLPDGWTKHISKKTVGLNAGKWEAIIVSPDNRKFRGRSEIKHYLEETKLFPYDEKMFVFKLFRPKQRKSIADRLSVENKSASTPPPDLASDVAADADLSSESTIEEEVNHNLLKILMVEGGYECPIEGCRKLFRRENLAQMHVKHYHPEFTKFLDSTPNVADLAYARTVGESLDKSPATPKATIKSAKTSTPKYTTKATDSPVHEPELTVPPKTKDTEIIKLLNSKSSFDVPNEPVDDVAKPVEQKLKELLLKPLDTPKSPDFVNKPLTPKQTGIKTLLPVIRPTSASNDTAEQTKPTKSRHKRKRSSHTDQVEAAVKNKNVEEPPQIAEITPAEPAPIPEQPSVIMEGGQLIKIVRMKQEEIINCTCRFAEEDGLMIQCEVCLCWQHAYCNNIERESQVPDKYICHICQNPYRQRSSRKYYHDQEWLKQGVLPVASYHCKDEDAMQKRFEKLKQAHDISGGLVELQQYFDSLKVKLKIAEAKNHPKLYLWSKPWEKLPLPEKQIAENEAKLKIESLDELIKEENVKTGNQADNMLLMMFKDKDIQGNNANNFPQPEAAIETADCRLNLLEHVLHSQNLVMERLDDFERQIEQLEEFCAVEKDENYPNTRHTLNMLLRDLDKLQDLSQCSSI